MTTHMNRPHQPYPPMYHTPQSNSPASVASPGGADHRSVYSNQSMSQPVYGYSQPYSLSQYQAQNQHMTNQSLLMSQAGAAMTPPHGNMTSNPSPRNSISKGPIQRPNHQSTSSISNSSSGQGVGVQAPISNGMNVGSVGGMTNGGMTGGQSNAQINPNAAPGPIPATTPLVVRQDNNGVQWILFEYSRDRVKMEYTIRCDVESVNVDNLAQDFKTENCVYPRACCSKEAYRGNRLQYESECNSVGWALADLNPCLRGKRGLIQRAVDSWRNSNQDPRLRSRRVRRMAKLSNRKAVHSTGQVNSINTASPVHNSSMNMVMKPGPGAGHVQPSSSLQTHHSSNDVSGGHDQQDMGNMLHHHHANQSPFAGNTNLVGVHGHPHLASRSSSGHISPTTGAVDDYNNGHHHHHHQVPTSAPGDMQPRHVYQTYPTSYPTETGSSSSSLPPPLHDSLDNNITGHNSNSNTGSNMMSTSGQGSLSTPPAANASLFGDIPEHKRRKFILVDDPHRGSRVRVRVMLDQVEMDEIPDSYRKSNSVYPRSYYARQMQSPPPASDTVVSSQIQVRLLDGSSVEVSTPPPSKIQKSKEMSLNDLGYRMSWSQSRVFAGRTMFLQRALDAYRNKMRSSMMSAGQDVTSIAPHLETRVGKRKWLERNRRSKTSADN